MLAQGKVPTSAARRDAALGIVVTHFKALKGNAVNDFEPIGLVFHAEFII